MLQVVTPVRHLPLTGREGSRAKVNVCVFLLDEEVLELLVNENQRLKWHLHHRVCSLGEGDHRTFNFRDTYYSKCMLLSFPSNLQRLCPYSVSSPTQVELLVLGHCLLSFLNLPTPSCHVTGIWGVY